MEKMLTIKEVADILRLSTKTIYNYVWHGKLKAVQIGSAWRIKPADLEAFVTDRSGK